MTLTFPILKDIMRSVISVAIVLALVGCGPVPAPPDPYQAIIHNTGFNSGGLDKQLLTNGAYGCAPLTFYEGPMTPQWALRSTLLGLKGDRVAYTPGPDGRFGNDDLSSKATTLISMISTGIKVERGAYKSTDSSRNSPLYSLAGEKNGRAPSTVPKIMILKALVDTLGPPRYAYSGSGPAPANRCRNGITLFYGNMNRPGRDDGGVPMCTLGRDYQMIWVHDGGYTVSIPTGCRK